MELAIVIRTVEPRIDGHALPPLVTTRGTGPAGVDSEGEPLPVASPMLDTPSNENFGVSSLLTGRVASARGVVDRIAATITEAVTTVS